MNVAAVLALTCLTVGSSLGCSPSADIAHDAAGGPALDFRGAYSITVTNGANGCAFGDWQQGDSNANIPFVVEQQGETASARVDGIPGALLGFLHGSNQFSGSVTADRIVLRIFGTVASSQDGCPYTWNNEVTARLQGDYLVGKLVYSRAHSDNPNCAALTCETVQQFNGTRPPAQ